MTDNVPANDKQIVVIGAGVAGVSTALWLRSLGLPFAWVAKGSQVGGTLQRVGNAIENYAGLWVSSGPALVENLKRQLTQAHLAPRLSCRAVSLQLHKDSIEVRLRQEGHCEQLQVRAVALCTGTTPRMLGLPAEKTLWRRGVETAVTRNLPRYAGKPVAVVGGGDAALEGALLLANGGSLVHLVHRRPEFRAQKRFCQAVRQHPRIVMHTPAAAVGLALQGSPPRLVGVVLNNGSTLAVQGLFQRLGVRPVLPKGVPKNVLDEQGYLVVDRRGVSAWPSLYGAGDVTSKTHQSVAWAAGQGARVAQSIQEDLGLRG